MESTREREYGNRILEYIQEMGSITNTKCRELLGIDYDQAIQLFNGLVNDGKIIRKGKAASTHYVLPEQLLPLE